MVKDLRQILLISYSHDSDEHLAKVLALSERLRRDGFNTRLDRYVNGTPDQGWPRWMLDQLDEAKFVLVVCTETYYRRFRGHEQPGIGKGVSWEGNLITQEIYDSRNQTTKFVPVLFHEDDARFIPEPLRAHTFYLLSSEREYSNLVDFLNGVAGIKPGVIGNAPENQSAVEPAKSMHAVPTQSSAIQLWKQKLQFLEIEEAKVVDPPSKFKIQQDIAEAKRKIIELGGQL